jgi:MoxR-like ATPase
VSMTYPAPREEAQMIKVYGLEPPIARPILDARDVAQLQTVASRVYVEDDLLDYAVAIAAFTRGHPRVALGASPRASLGLIAAAKAWAMIGGRPFVAPDDIRAIATSVLAHRMVMTTDAEAEPKSRERVVEEALQKVGYRRGMRAV